ncbi:class I SAM-dependent methyltransferase [Rugamonas apoptosis]|uniref:Class I SAM-dependent methyltransferase n=1 Tax=Rugamonas apoptosis TaxID=2758570 RepID=A0A7W2F749_9BURK|nr:class I SAM-dependent methyltransferase [Rugamonas apoptosis]MBA5686204.1 class I SAM-dependent methyltransferase [Rugamonas apoptosis]
MSPEAYLEMAATEQHHWWFTGRRAILDAVLAGMGLPAAARILEIGSGTGGNLDLLAGHGTVSAVEMDPTARSIALDKTGHRFDIRQGRCPDNVPFPPASFDLVCMFDVLEHIDEDVATLAVAKALLASGGRILLTVPANRWMWGPHDVFLHHKRRYSSAELRRKAGAAGLRMERLTHFNTLLFPLAAVMRIKDRLAGTQAASGTAIPAAPINQVLRHVFSSERHLLRWMPLPFGVSLLAILSAA